MKIKSILAILLAGTMLASVTSCKDEEADYTPADVLSGQQVYFANTLATTVELDPDTNVVSIPLNRVNTSDGVTVNVATVSQSEIFEVAKTASFAPGANTANIDITYDPEKIEAGHYDTIQVSIADKDYTTPYGITSLTLYVGQKEPWLSLGTGLFYDGFMDDYMWYVEVQQNQLDPSRYRVVKPYGPMWNYYEEAERYAASSEYLTFRVLENGEDLGGIAVEGDNQVYFAPVNTGYLHSSYSEYIWAYHVAHFKSASAEKYQYTAITAFQEDGSIGEVQLCPLYFLPSVGGGWDYTTKPYIVIQFPGYEPKDYGIEVTYAGKYYDTEDNLYAVADVPQLGADVAEAKLMVVPGKDNIAEAFAYLVYGEKESEDIVTITETGKYNLAMPENAESGNYTVVGVTYDEAGEAQNYNYSTFKYTAADGGAKETWSPAYIGDYTYSLLFTEEDGSPYVDEGLVLYTSDTTPNRYKIAEWGYGVDFIFSMDPSTGELSFDDFDTGADYGDYGDIYAKDAYHTYDGQEMSYYDKNSGTFNFNIVYAVAKGVITYGFETFTLTGKASAKTRPAKANTSKMHVRSVDFQAPTNCVEHKLVKNAGKAKNSSKITKMQAKPYDLFSKYAK